MVAAYPVPDETVINRAMLSTWRDRGALLLQHCLDCGLPIYYPRCMCPQCWSTRLEGRVSCGRGQIETFSVVHRAIDEAFDREGAVVLAEVRVDEGVSLITRIVCDDASSVQIGERVRLYDGDRDRYPLPVFVVMPQEPP